MRAPRNVIFIICHDMSRRFGVYGDTTARTPNFDRLAGQSVRFNAHCCHTPRCGPSRANLLTGCRTTTTGRWNNEEFFSGFRAKTGYPTLTEHLRNHGYKTVALNQVMHGRETDGPSWDRQWWPEGFVPRDWVGAYANARGSFRHYRTRESFELMLARARELEARGLIPSQHTKSWRGPAYENGGADPGYETEIVTNEALRTLRSMQSAGAPFFLGIGYETGHLPFCAPGRFFDLYRESDFRLPECGGWPSGMNACGAMAPEAKQYYTTDYGSPSSAGWRPSEQEARRMVHAHYAATSYFDAQIGRLLDTIESQSLLEDTLIVCTTDHGLSVGEHGHWGKKTLLETDIGVPLLVRHPDLPPSVCDTATEHVDLYPTLCEWCGVPTPMHCEGESLASLMAQTPGRRKHHALSFERHTDASGRSVRMGSYRLTRWEHRGTALLYELYDYGTDPHETRNQYAQLKSRQEVREMERLLLTSPT